MNEKAITLTVFFISVFLLYQIRLIIRLRKLKKIRGDVTEKGFVHVAFIDLFAECLSFICTLPCIIIGFCLDVIYERQQEKNAIEQNDGVEQRIKENLAEIEQEKIEWRVEELRASGYVIADKDRNKVIDVVSISPEINLSWTSASTRLPIEEIIIIIENEPDFEIRDEYIINKKKILEKRKTTKNVCSICANPYKLGSEFCPNCGQKLSDTK